MSDQNASTGAKFKALYIAIPLLASGVGGGIGAYTTISVQSSKIEGIQRNVDSLTVSMNSLTLSASKLVGIVEERGPRIAELENQVNNLSQRVDRITDGTRK